MDASLWIIIAGTFLSGLFALLGFSIQAYRRSVMEDAFGPKKIAYLENLEHCLPSLRLTLPFCRMLSNFMLAGAMIYYFNGLGMKTQWHQIAQAVAMSLVLIAVFGLAIPHAWASYSWHRVLTVMYWPLMIVRYVFYPISALLMAFDTPVRRLSGAEEDVAAHENDALRQDILQAVTDGHAEGVVQDEQARIIESVMKFGSRRIGEIMTPRTEISAIPSGLSWAQAIEQAHKIGHSRIPVFDGDIDNIIGVLYAKDLLQPVNVDLPPDINSILRKPVFVPQTKNINDMLREFKMHKTHLAVVLDEFGGTAGLITFEDVLEEIVGDIADEYDLHEKSRLHLIDGKVAEADGILDLEELNKVMNADLPRSDSYDTIAGLVLAELGYIPSVGEKIKIGDATITVLAATDRRIMRLRIELHHNEKSNH